MNKINILVVEDERIIGAHLEKAINGFGFNVPAVVSSGKAALKWVEKSCPDLVLIDILLKGEMDGIEVARIIRHRYKIPVVFLTAYADEKTLQSAKEAGPYGYLIKPFQERELNSTIKIALHRHNVEAELETRTRWLFGALSRVKDGVIATDKKGLVIYMNALAEELTGFKEGFSRGKELGKVFNITYNLSGKENPVEVQQHSSKSFQEELVLNLESKTFLRDRKGRRVPVQASFFPMNGESGENFGGVVVFHRTTGNDKNPVPQKGPQKKYPLEDLHRPLLFNVGESSYFSSQNTEALPRSNVVLTRREIEILCLLSRGMVAKEISENLNISNATVRTHIQRILQKLKVHTKLEAVVVALQKNFIDIPPG